MIIKRRQIPLMKPPSKDNFNIDKNGVAMVIVE
jgi:hypothetical protein